MNLRRIFFLVTFCLITVVASATRADITDFTTWTLVEDPPHASFSGGTTTAAATLSASTAGIPLDTDIGFQSINGNTAATSTQGYVFSPSSDYSIAIDYSWAFAGSPAGFLSLGLGVGEDSDGRNSVGVVMATNGGVPFSNFGGGARVNDVDQTAKLTTLPATAAGSLFISYEAASGDITFGASQTPGAAAPTVTDSYAGIQNLWNDEKMLVSFLIRSGPFVPWSGGGTGDATFTNFRVLNGTAVAVPEPTSLVLLIFAGVGLASRRRRR